jgi:hypothetical protein
MVTRLMRQLMLKTRHRKLPLINHQTKYVTSEWSPLDSAPKDRTWIKVRGWDFGIEGSRRHYAIARFDDDKWIAISGEELSHLTDWQALPRAVGTGPFLENRCVGRRP